MKKLFILLVTCVLVVSNALAQEGSPIEYGETVTGEISDEKFEVPYTFEGNADDIVVIQMEETEVFGDLSSPLIILLNENNRVVTDSSRIFSIGDATLVTQLPADGTYTILATRSDGRAGDSVGEFVLRLINVPLLSVNGTVSEQISSEDTSQYFAVVSDGSDMTLTYEKQAGTFAPEITISRLESDGELTEMVTLSGDALERGTVNVPSSRGTYIISLAPALFDFNFREVTADYELTLAADE